MRFQAFRSNALGLLVIASISLSALAEDWPQWRGPNRDGVWHAEGLVEQLPEGQLPLDWTVEIGPGYNGPTVANGRVYVMDRITENEQAERVLCLNSKTGEKLWEFTYPAAYTISYTAGPRASVTIDQDRAYTVGAMGHFHCLNAATGEVIWKRDLNADYSIEMPIWGIAASPLIYNDLVVQQVSGADGACMVAFNKSDGKEVWRSLSEKAGYASPIIIQQAGQDVLVCWTGESLSGLDPTNGTVHWAHAMPPTRMPIGIATPSLSDGLIFVSSFYDGSLMVRPSTQALTCDLVWRALGVDEKSTASTKVQLREGLLTEGGPYGVHSMIGTPIIQDGLVYAVDSYGEFRGLDALTGKRLWEDNTAVKRERWATIHMVRQADRVWMFNEQGELMIAKLNPTGLEIQSRAQLIAPTRVQLNRRDGVCWSHPAFAEQSVFARSDDRIVRASLAAESQK